MDAVVKSCSMSKLELRQIITVVFFCVFSCVYAQDFLIKEVRHIQEDLSGSVNSRVDANNKGCALVKVQCPLDDIVFEGNIIGDVARNAGEYWVYLSEGTKMLQIKHATMNPILVKFSEYDISGLLPKQTYCIRLIVKNNMLSNIEIKPDPNRLGDSPYFSVSDVDKKITIREAHKKCRTIILDDYLALTLQKASEYNRNNYGAKYELNYSRPGRLMDSFIFPMNYSKFLREGNQYTISFTQLNEPPISLQIIFSPEKGDYSFVFTNVDEEKSNMTIKNFKLSKQEYLWLNFYSVWRNFNSEGIFATIGNNSLSYPFLFDILDYWVEKYGK